VFYNTYLNFKDNRTKKQKSKDFQKSQSSRESNSNVNILNSNYMSN
jgi:hypothetical protein